MSAVSLVLQNIFRKCGDILSSPVLWTTSPWEPSLGRVAFVGPLTLIGVWVDKTFAAFSLLRHLWRTMPSLVFFEASWGPVGGFSLVRWIFMTRFIDFQKLMSNFAFSCLITCILSAEVYLMQTGHLSASFPPFQVFLCDANIVLNNFLSELAVLLWPGVVLKNVSLANMVWVWLYTAQVYRALTLLWVQMVSRGPFPVLHGKQMYFWTFNYCYSTVYYNNF